MLPSVPDAPPTHLVSVQAVPKSGPVKREDQGLTCMLSDIPVQETTDVIADGQGGNCSGQREDKDIARTDSFVW